MKLSKNKNSKQFDKVPQWDTCFNLRITLLPPKIKNEKLIQFDIFACVSKLLESTVFTH